jgi:RimJ/RimL family protein N-acetyltransferase
MSHIKIQTNRLVIKDLIPSNAEDMFTYRADEEISKYQSFCPKRINDVLSFIGDSTKNFDEQNNWFQVGIFFNEKIIGDIGIHFIGPENKQVEIGYTISRDFQRQGFGKEAVIGVINYLFNDLKKHRIIASLDPMNSASIALLESIGFRKEGLLKKSIFNQGIWKDDLLYALLNEEWK